MQMQKKIITLAIAATLTAPALVFAEATVYGQANVSVDVVNDGKTPSSTTNQLNSGGSRLGFKGSQELGNDLSVVWVLEGDVAVDTGGTTQGQLFDRLSNIGLKSGSMGTVAFGLQDTPYKASTRALDLFGDSAADDRRMMGIGHNVATKNTISYASPSMNGFSVAGATVFGAESATAGQTKGTALGLAGMYNQGPIYVTLAYDGAKYGNTGTGDQAAPAGTAAGDKDKDIALGGSYSMDAITVNAVIEQHTITLATASALGNAGDNKGTNVYLAAKFNVNETDAVKAAYTKRGSTTGATNDANQYAIGYDHAMGKATSVYALYTKVTDNAPAAADPSILSVGLKHSF
jgi:predicted porin